MNPHLAFDFSINKKNNTVNVTREFAANLELVWDAWTKPELLDQWWAPRPYQSKTKSMDFREGGTWLYAMVGPNNESHWCRADYLKINTHKNYSAIDAFCDEEGNMNTEFPRSNWNNAFEGNGNTTTVHVTITYQQLADLEKIIELGFKEGFTMAMGNLEEYLSTQMKNRNESK